MTCARFTSVIGLGFGDCGKGLITDALVRERGARTVVRWNGGAQAGHNVMLPDGRHHTFSQFSAGSFVPGVITVLAAPVVVHPTALLIEHDALRRKGVEDALARLRIDHRCRVTTPFHQAGGRLRELLRGEHPHGSCGVGVGETVRHRLDRPLDALTYGDLRDPGLTRHKLEQTRRALLDAFGPQLGKSAMSAERMRRSFDELAVLRDPAIAERWRAHVAPLLEHVHPASCADLQAQLGAHGAVIFEGAQGALLDEWRGFHPHTSWSTIHPRAVEAVTHDLGIDEPFEHLGVIRSFLTRHGAGPLPTQHEELAQLPEAHNSGEGWQGPMRRGHPDAVLLRYAHAVLQRLDGIAVTHLDVLRHTPLRWCGHYRTASTATGELHVLPVSTDPDLAHQEALTRMLFEAEPIYDRSPISNPEELFERIKSTVPWKLLYAAFGPTYTDVMRL